MTLQYQGSSEVERFFPAAVDQFEVLLKSLMEEQMLKQADGDVEKWLYTEGTELLRRLLQSHLRCGQRKKSAKSQCREFHKEQEQLRNHTTHYEKPEFINSGLKNHR